MSDAVSLLKIPHKRLNVHALRFPFDVMFRELADINARNTGKSVTIVNQFAEYFVVHPSFLQIT